MTGTALSADVWYLIFQNVPDTKDLANLSRVCKTLYSLSTKFLYRIITIGPSFADRFTYRFNMNEGAKSDSKRWAESLALVRRLAAEPNTNQTRTIREINIETLDYYSWNNDDKLGDPRPKFEESLPGFVSVLPNLQHVRIFSSTPAFDALFRALEEHPNKPEIHLVKEDGLRLILGPMPLVVTLKVDASPWRDTPEKPNTVLPNTEKLFFACPDLKSFSLSVRNDYGGCMRPRVHHEIISTFQFAQSGNEVVFPPLESLSFSGYDMDADEEWPHWRDGMDWSQLKRLNLGPDPRYAGGPTMAHLLRQFKGYANTLRSLTVQTWADEGHETCHPLESFLESFDTLEVLTVKRHFVPVEKLVRHERLKKLCLHCIELQRPEGTVRPTLDVVDLDMLDASCPELEHLEIDISRDKQGGWPKDAVDALAGSFKNLTRLTLHCEVGLNFDWTERQDEPFFPVLDEALIKAFAEPFFAKRGDSRMEKLTIKTGETLRRFPQWHPAYRRLEQESTREFDAWLQSGDGKVKVERVSIKSDDDW